MVVRLGPSKPSRRFLPENIFYIKIFNKESFLLEAEKF